MASFAWTSADPEIGSAPTSSATTKMNVVLLAASNWNEVTALATAGLALLTLALVIAAFTAAR
jgi:hypothetical protein